MKIFKGNLFSTPEFGKLIYGENQLIVVNDEGYIESIYDPEKDKTQYQHILSIAQEDDLLVEFDSQHVLLPGFIDLHIHAPQWVQAGIALDEPLNVWLDECTFPLEGKYQDLNFATLVYQDLVRNLLAHGTTTALYFATIHREASYKLAEICAELGQRGLVGKVVMDKKDSCPDYYRDETTEVALAETELFIQQVQALNERTYQGVYPVVTPRFIPSCTDEALKGMGELAQKYDVHVQSHCSEGQWEHDTVFERYGKSDTEALRDFNLLGKKSVMAHAPYLSDHDCQIFHEAQTAIAHCPISNAYFANGVLPVKKFHQKGVEIGLGSDISGGFSPSLYDNLKQAVMSSRMLEDGVDVQLPIETRGKKDSRITMTEAFYLATKAGGRALDLPIGAFEPGMACDFQVIDLQAITHPLPDFGVFNEPEQLLHRILYLANSENIKEVYVQSKLVHSRG